MYEFQIDGTTFGIEPLKLKQSLKAEALLAEVFLPAFAAFATVGNNGGIDPAALAGLERIDELVDIFAGVCKFARDNDGAPTTGTPEVRLSSFLDQCFSRRNAALLAWLVACVEYQFGDFLDGTGQRLLEETVSRYTSLLESIGGSGGSSPTEGSPTG